MDALLLIGSTLVNAVIIGFFARRLIGVPVGWPRTIAVSLLVVVAVQPVLTGLLSLLDIRPESVNESEPGALALAVGVIILIVAWVFVLEIIVLVIGEAVAPTGSLPSPLQWLESLPARRRRGQRYLTIMAIATKHGLGGYFRPRRRQAPLAAVAGSVREAMTEAGVTFVKLGQMLATRPDLVPEPLVREFSQLHSSVPPEPWTTIEPVITAELGRPWQEVFARLDEQPLAAASVAQIHTGALLDGTEVVVKVQRTRARDQAVADLDIVSQLAARLEATAAWARRLRLSALAKGFADSLLEELDYRVELANMQAVAAASDAVRVPVPYPELSSSRLLVMERLAGEPLSRATGLVGGFDAEERTRMAQDLFAAVLRQVMVSGVFHADLHPGNIIVLPDATLGLLDLGSVGRLDQGARTSLGAMMLAVDRGDAISATDALIDLLDRPVDLDDRALEREVGQLVVRYGSGLGPGGSTQMFGELTRLVVRHHFSIPPQIAAAFRALGALEGSLQLLTRDIDLVASAREQGRKLMQAQQSPEAVRTQVQSQLATVLPLVQRLPRRLNRITEQLEEGRFGVSVRIFHHPDDRSFITGVVQQLVVSVLAASLGLAGVVLLVSTGGPVVGPDARIGLLPLLGAVLLLFAFTLGARVLVLVFRQRT